MVTYTSPNGDLLVIDPQRNDVRVITHEHVRHYQTDRSSAPAYRVYAGLHLATLSLGVEMGLSFELAPTALLPGLVLLPPVLCLQLAGKVKAILAQDDIPIVQCRQLFATDRELRLIVCLTYVLPRSPRFDQLAVQLMRAPFKDQLPRETQGGTSA